MGKRGGVNNKTQAINKDNRPAGSSRPKPQQRNKSRNITNKD